MGEGYRRDRAPHSAADQKVADLPVCQAARMELDLTTLRVDVTDGVAVVTIDHPPINLLDAAMMVDLVRLEAAARAEPDDVRVVILRSADPEFFIAHADLELIRALPRDPQPRPTELGFFHSLLERLRTLPQITIAEIDGIARGGGSELALSLDLRFASDRSVLAQPEVALGIIPGGGGTQRLGRFAGRARALEIALGCDDFDAATAAQYGWINRALAADELRPFVDRLARRIAAFPPAAVRAAKVAVDAAAPPFLPGLLDEQVAWDSTMTDPDLDARFDAAVAAGAQTRAGELHLDDVIERSRRTTGSS